MIDLDLIEKAIVDYTNMGAKGMMVDVNVMSALVMEFHNLRKQLANRDVISTGLDSEGRLVLRVKMTE